MDKLGFRELEQDIMSWANVYTASTSNTPFRTAKAGKKLTRVL